MSLSVPPTYSVALFPPIRAGRGRHRLPTPVRRRPGPITAGFLVAATTLAVGSLRQFPGSGEKGATASARPQTPSGTFPQVAGGADATTAPHG
ncbi:hypothetical protein ABH931_001698 [Streptacidiphilus sp. MAP12-33]